MDGSRVGSKQTWPIAVAGRHSADQLLLYINLTSHGGRNNDFCDPGTDGQLLLYINHNHNHNHNMMMTTTSGWNNQGCSIRVGEEIGAENRSRFAQLRRNKILHDRIQVNLEQPALAERAGVCDTAGKGGKTLLAGGCSLKRLLHAGEHG